MAQAGRSGAVTIATNMAGRGTDIVLGGNPDAVATHELKDIQDPAEFASRLAKLRETCVAGQAEGRWRRAGCTSSAPSGTSRGASTTSCAAAPDARATPARRGSTSRSRTT